MHDIRTIREAPETFDRALARRGLPAASAEILALDTERREAQTRLQELRQRRNALSKEIGGARKRGEEAQPLMDEVAGLRDSIRELEETDRAVGERIETILIELPNLPANDVPDGADEFDNREERKVGAPATFGFSAKEHFDLGENLGMMDFALASKLSGARFVVLKGALARLERALATFMLDLHVGTFGYREVAPPFLVRGHALQGTGQLPKFGEDLFRTTDDFWLIPTAEVPLTNLVAGEILDPAALPLRFTAHTPCFRSEAGAAGRDTRGMLRQHQFSKVELVSIAHPDRSGEEHERMTACAEEVLKRLGLAYRVVTLCAGDMGFSARKTYDIEVWLPGQGSYREISSCSNTGEFQARRMRARFRDPDTKATRFVHCLNGSGLAVGRCLIAILETYQQADGSILIPETLRPYMGGMERLAADV